MSLLAVALLLAAVSCISVGPSQARPTATPLPTFTPIPASPTPTITPVPTSTSTVTPTPTVTPVPQGPQGPQVPTPTVQVRSVRGFLLLVDKLNQAQTQSVTVKDFAGRDWTFLTSNVTNVTAAHLDEHLVQRVPVTVNFVEQGQTLVAVSIDD